VSGTSNVGGFAGLMTYSGGISTSYATGMVTASGDSAGGFLGNTTDTSYTRTLQDFYATGAVIGTTNVGGLVGYAARATFNYGYSTGIVLSTNSATSVGGSFGGVGTGTTVTGTSPNQVTTYWVIRNNLYYDSSTSGMSTDAAGVGGTGPATGLATASLLNALPHANFATGTWGTGTDLYPYLKAIYGNSTPQAISGYAYLADGTTKAVKAQVGIYGGGYLLNGGTMTTGANGFFYELLANTTGSPLFSDAKLVVGASTKLANTLSLYGSTTVVGMAYSDTQVLTGNNLVIDGSGIGLGKVLQGLTKLRTADASMSALNANMDSIMGSTAGTLNRSVFAATLPTNSSLDLTSTVAAFDLNTALNYGKTTASNAGWMTFNGLSSNGTTFTLSGATYTSALTQNYNGLVTLGANTTLTGTQITTASTVAGSVNRYNLTVNGPLTTGGAITNLGAFTMNGLATLGGTQVTSGGAQTYNGNVVMQDTGAVFTFNSTLGGNGANIGFTGTSTLTSPTTKALTLNAGTTGNVSILTPLANTAAYTDVSVTGANLTLQAVAASNTVTLNPTGVGTVDVISGATTTLTKGAAGVMNLTAANTYGGSTTINAGILKLSGASSLTAGSYAAGIAVGSGATLQDSSSVDHVLTGVISGNGGIVKDTSTSALTLSGNNAFTGSVTLNAGTINVTHNNGLGTAAGGVIVANGTVLDLQGVTVGAEAITLNGGTLKASTGASSLSGAVTLGAASTFSVPGTALTLSGVVNDTSYGVTLRGPGNLTLSNASNTIHTMATSSALGALSMKNSVALDVGLINATGDVTIANTANLTLMSGQGISTTTGNIVLAASKFFNRAGASALSVSNGHTWQVWSANLIPLETEANGGDENGGLVNNYVQYGATYGTSAVLGTGNGLLYTYAPVLTGSLVGTMSKPYDGTDSVVLQPNNILVTGLLNGDVLTVTQTTNSHYTSAGTATSIVGVGIGKTVSVNGMIVTAFNAVSNKTIYGYVFSAPTLTGIGDITLAPITLTMSKNYDGNASFSTANAYTVSGIVAGDVVTLNGGSATVSSPNASTYNSLLTNTFSITSDKYTLTGARYNMTIDKMPLVVTVRATYSGSTALVPTSVAVTGLINGETMVPTAVVAQSADVSSNGNNFMTAITASTGNADFNNYSITVANSPVTIDRKVVTLTGALGAPLTASKTYDGNTSGTVSTVGVTPNVVYFNDDVTVSAITGTYDSPNVSNSRVVTLTGVTFTGAKAGNYLWDSASGQTAVGTVVQLPSATWVGAAGGNWSNPANWAVTGNLTQTGVLPNLSNVALAVIPTGGAVVANAATAYTGKIALAGTLRVASDSYLGATPSSTTADMITLDGGTLNATESFTLNANRGITLTSNGGTFQVDASKSLNYEGVLQGTGGLTKSGNGTMVVSGANSYTSTTLSAGTLQVGNGSTTGSLGTGAVDVTGTLAFNRTDALTVTQDIAGAGGVTQLGSNTLTFTGAQTYTGSTNTGPVGSQLIYTRNTVPNTAGFTGNGVVTLQPLANASFGAALNTSRYTFANTLTGLTLGHSANTTDITLGAAVSIAGPVSLYGGALALNANLTTTDATTGDVWLSGSSVNGAYNLALADGRALTITQTGNGVLSGVISGNGVSLTKVGSGALTLTGTNTYSGATTVSAGTMGVYNNSALGTGTATWANNTSLELGSSVTTVANNMVLNGATTVSFETSLNLASTLAGRLTGVGGLSVNATGDTLTLSGNNAYTGTTSITGGKVITSHANALGNNSAVTLSNVSGAVLQLNSSLGIGSLAGGGSTGGNLVLSAGAVLSAGGNNTSTTFDGAMSGAGGLNKTGTGTWTVTSNGTYTGTTTISAGELVLSNNAPTTASASFSGAGKLRIESVGTGFTGAFSTSGWTFGNTLGSLTVGKTTNTNAVSLYDIAIAGPISAYGGTLNVNGHLNTTAGGVAGDVWLKSSGDISLATTKSITTSGGDVVLWSNSDNQATNGSILLYGGSSITTGGGHLWMAGGAASATTWHGLTVGDGYAVSGTVITGTGNAANFGQVGVFMEEASLSTGGGDILIRGKTTTFRGFLATGAVDINAGSGKIYIEGVAVGDGAGAGAGWHHSPATAFRNGIFTLTSSNADADAIVWLTDATQSVGTGLVTDGAGEGAGLAGTTSLLATGGGGISFTSLGSATKTGAFGVRLGYLSTQGGVLNLLASSGDITLNTGARSVGIVNNLGSATLGAKSGTAVTVSSSNISVVSDDVSASGTMAFNTAGQLTIKPRDGYSFTSTFDTTKLTYQGGVSGLFIGHSTSTGNVTVNSNTTIAGPIEIYGGTLTVNAPLVATNNGIIKLKGSTLTDGVSGYITADKLAILGGAVTLDNASNAVNTLAASGVGGFTFVNSAALTIGTVNPTGITATGDVRIETLSGDLTIAQNVSTTSTTANAVLLNAGKSTAAGTATGGNILISGTPTITAGVGGTIRLMGGSVADSTGLTTLVGSGTGRFRYNSDETSTNYTWALSPNVVNAIYREQPTATANIDSYAVTYGFDHTLTLSNLKPDGSSALSTVRVAVNGDANVAGLGVLIEGATYSTAGKLNYRVTPYTLTDGLAKLGYAMNQTGGSLLTVDKKAVNLVGFLVDNKVYDGNANATFSGAVTFSALEANDVMTYTSATGAFADRHVGTKLVTVTGVVVAGADKDNYTVTWSSGNASATISQRASVTWVGGSGSWSDASNWAVTGALGQTGVLPDGANVAVAVLPVGFAGTLTSSYAHAYEGKIVVNGGTLSVAADAYLGATTPAAVTDRITLNGGTLQATDNFTLDSKRGITLGASGGTFTVDPSMSVNYAGVMAGTGGLTKSGSGTLTLTGVNSYSGGTTVAAGQLVAGGTSTALGSSSVTVSGTRLSFDTAAAVTYANAISLTGAGLLDNIGNNMVTFTGGVNTNRTNGLYTTVVDGGTSGVTIANVMTPTGAGASYYIKGNVTFTGHNMSSLVVRAAGEATAKFTSSNGVNAFNLWFIGSDTAAYAMNIDVAAGVTVNEDAAQGAASLYYKNITGAGTLFMGGANNTTGYVLGDVTIANLKGSGSKTISIGNGGSAGRLLSGNVQATGGLLLNSTTDYTFTGIQSIGALTKQQANTVKLTGNNTSIGAITVSAGILQVGDAGTTGSITGNASVALGAGLVFSRSDAASYVGNLSGAGTVSKLGTNVLTLTGTQTYTGATATGEAGGGLVFTNNTLPITPGAFTGNGTVTIQPVVAGSFGGTLSTNAYTFGSSLTGLTLGRDGNTATITVNSPLSIAGPISIYGGTINLNADITSTAANASVLFKSAGDIAQATNVDVLTAGGSTVYWANSDGGNSAGMVLLDTGATITTQGGHVWLGGSATANGQTTWHGLTVGDGYAASGSTVHFAGGADWQGGIVLKRSQISSAGGDVSLYGYGAAGGSGFVNFDNTTINAGTGQILINAKSIGIVAFLPGLHPSVLPNEVLELRSANMGVDAIRVITDAVATNDPGAVIEGNFQMNATQGGGVTLSGRAKAGVAGVQVGSQWGGGVMDALSTTGNITLDAGTNSISFQNAASAIYLGSKTGSAVTSATGNIVLNADSLSLASAVTYANTTGSLTIAPTSASFSSAVNSTGWVLGSGLTALTVGNPTNTANITWSSSNTVNGPIRIYGGNITLNSAIGTTNTSTGDVLLRGADINSAYNISVASGRTLALDHTGSNSIVSGIISGTSANLVKQGTGAMYLRGVNTYSGLTTIAAGFLELDQTGSLVTDVVNNAGFGFNQTADTTFAKTISGTGYLVKYGANTLTLTAANTYTGITNLQGGTLSVASLANGGVASNIGQSTNAAANLFINNATLEYTGAATSTDRLFTLGDSGATVDASGSGALVFTNTGALAYSGTAGRLLTLTGNNTADNTMTPVLANNAGVSSFTKAGTGKWVMKGTNTYTGVTTLSGGTLNVGDGADALASLGTNTISLGAGTTLNFNHNASVTVANAITGAGQLNKLDGNTLSLTGLNSYTGATDTGSAGGVVFTNNTAPTTSGFTGSGAVTIEPAGNSFGADVTTNYTYANTISGLTLGKSGNLTNVTLNSLVAIAGPIRVDAPQITVNQALSSTGAGLTLNGASVLKGGSITVAGSQTYNGAVTLDDATTLTSTGSGAITFANTLNGAYALAVNTSGATTFTGAVGGTTALTSLTTDAGGTVAINGGVVNTTGVQSYGEAATLGADTTLSSTGSGAISFGNTLNGAYALAVNTSGATTFTGAVGGTTALTSLSTDAGGTVAINGGVVNTTGLQSYGEAATLGADTTLSSTGSGAISFGNTLNGAYALAVNTSGATTFAGAVGGTTALTSLTTDAGGTVAINGGVVNTTGAQSYGESVHLGAATALAGVNVALMSTVDGAVSLSITDSGTTVLGGIIGGTTPLMSLSTDALGYTHLKGASIHTTTDAVFNDIVTLFTDVQIQAAGQLHFAQTIDGNTANTRSLTLNGGNTAAIRVEGAIGATMPLKTLTVYNSESTTFTGPVTTGTSVVLTDTGLGIAFNGGLTTPTLAVAAESFDLTLRGGVNVTNAVTLANTGNVQLGVLATDNLYFAGGLLATAPRAMDMAGLLRTTNQALVLGSADAAITLLANTDINTGAGSVSLISPVSAGTHEYTLRLLGTGATTVDGNMTSAGALSFVGPVSFNSANATLSAASMTFGGAVTALGNLTIHGPTFVNGGGVNSGASTQTYDGDVTVGGAGPTTTFTGVGITFGAALNGTGRVVVADSGNTTYTGAIGMVTAPLHFETDAAGSSTFRGGMVRTSGPNSMLIADDVVVTSNTTFDTTNNGGLPTGANITFGKTLNGSGDNAQSVTLNAGTAGTVLVSGTVGNTHPLSTLTLVNSNGATFSSAVTTGTSVVLSDTSDGQTIRFAANVSTPLLTTATQPYALELLGSNTQVTGPLSTEFLNTGGLVLGHASSDNLTFTGGLWVTAPSSLQMAGTVNTSNAPMTLGDGTTAITLADHLTLDTAGGALHIDGAVDGSVANTQSLTLNATGAGVVNVTGALGQTVSLKTLTLSHSHGATFSSPVRADTSVVLSNTTAGQTIRFEDNLSTGTLTTTGNGYHLALLGASTHVTGATPFLNTGTLTLGDAATDNLAFDGGLVVTAPSSLSVGGVVNTTNAVMTLGDSNTVVVLNDNVTLNTAGGALSINGALNGTSANTQSLILNAGADGVVSVTGALGQTTSLNTLTLTHSHGATFSAAVTADTAVVLSNTTAGQTIRFEGNLSTGTLTTTGNGYHLALLGARTHVTGATTFLNTGTLTLGDAATDNLAFDGGLVVTAPSSLSVGGLVSTTNAVMTVGDSNMAVLLNDNLTLDSGSAALTLGGVVYGAHDLVLNSTGVTTVMSVVGGNAQALTSLSTNAGGTLRLMGGAITTTGAQTYNDDVVLGSTTHATELNTTRRSVDH
jgi:autotransporter-associated beta strand protein